MPTYLYACRKCGREIEMVQSIRDRRPPLCFEGDCGGEEMESIIQRSTFVLKGSGWAKDGYGGK